MELARAEVGLNRNASPTMLAFSRVRLEDAEIGVHRVLRESGFTAPVDIDDIDLGVPKYKRFPYIKLSTWIQLLLDTNRLARQFAGVPTIQKMKPVLSEFWKRFKQIHPNHGIFDLAESGSLSLDSTIPFYSHTDEGRSYKHLPIWILSSHGAIGRGTRLYLGAGKHRAPLRRNSMGLNFAGKSWATNFMFAAVMKTVSVECPDAISQLVAQYADDVRMLLEQGVRSRDGQTQIWMAHIATKGDLPALVKLGGMKRSYSNVPRGPTSKKACQGICHLCLAGQETDPARGVAAVPFEDVRPSATWTATIAQELPWDRNALPPILEGLPLQVEEQIKFFSTDLWHNVHLGVCKHFVASAVVCIAESGLDALPDGSMEVKFKWLTEIYRGYFRSQNMTPFVSELSRDTLNFPASTASPLGKWSKGSASTELMLFLDYFGRNYLEGKTDDPILLSIVSGSYWFSFSLLVNFRWYWKTQWESY